LQTLVLAPASEAPNQPEQPHSRTAAHPHTRTPILKEGSILGCCGAFFAPADLGKNNQGANRSSYSVQVDWGKSASNASCSAFHRHHRLPIFCSLHFHHGVAVRKLR